MKAKRIPVYRDGPLSVRRPEEIAFAVGRSAVGPVLVALGGAGIVAITVRENPGALVRDLKSRFPKARLVRDEAGCAGTLARVVAYIAAPVGRFSLALDMRGTEFQKLAWRAVMDIPFGETSTYSRIAEAIGAPKAIRAVASSCSRCDFAFAVPCHRVTHKGAGKGDPGRQRRRRWVDYEAKLARRYCKTAAQRAVRTV